VSLFCGKCERLSRRLVLNWLERFKRRNQINYIRRSAGQLLHNFVKVVRSKAGKSVKPKHEISYSYNKEDQQNIEIT
jgi:hypothetical protein